MLVYRKAKTKIRSSLKRRTAKLKRDIQRLPHRLRPPNQSRRQQRAAVHAKCAVVDALMNHVRDNVPRDVQITITLRDNVG